MKIYSFKYTDNDDLPKARPPIVISAGKLRSVAVEAPTEGSVTKIVIKQTAGTSVGATVRLLDSSSPYPPGEYNTGTAAADDIELYDIISPASSALTVTSGQALEIINQEYGYPYLNQDGTFTNNQRYIYLIISPTAAGTSTTWDVAMTIRTEVG